MTRELVLSPLQSETSVISALTNKLDEINLRVERLQEASSVTARKTGGGLFFAEGRLLSNSIFVALRDIGKRSAEKEDRRTQKPITTPSRGNAASEFSVFRHPSTHSFDRRRVHFQESAFSR
ncbi:hypothetical protein TNCV_1672191 [Trichonephila clavipes]|nr:hypothetical protein TNCV_1672191 [Trichonephila clavipes]